MAACVISYPALISQPGSLTWQKRLSRNIKRCRRPIALRNKSWRKNCKSRRRNSLRFRFVDFQYLIRFDVLQHLDGAARPADFDLVNVFGRAQSEVHAEVAR